MADQDRVADGGSTAASESTPLLATQGGNASHETTRQEDQPAAAPVRDRDAVIGSWVSLSAAVVSMAFWLVINILRQSEPRDYNLDWSVRQALNPVAVLVKALGASLCSIFNLVLLYRNNSALPTGLNLVVDIIVGFYVTVLSVNAAGSFPFGTSCYRYSDVPGDSNQCKEWRKMFEPFVWVFIGASLVLGLTHAILFIYRMVMTYRARNRLIGRWNRWSIPTGQLTFEFSVKLLREPRVATHQDQAVESQA